MSPEVEAFKYLRGQFVNFLLACVLYQEISFVHACVWNTRTVDSLPCCMRDPMVNQSAFNILNWFSTMSESGLHGCGFCHSYGVNLNTIKFLLLHGEVRRNFYHVKQRNRQKSQPFASHAVVRPVQHWAIVAVDYVKVNLQEMQFEANLKRIRTRYGQKLVLFSPGEETQQTKITIVELWGVFFFRIDQRPLTVEHQTNTHCIRKFMAVLLYVVQMVVSQLWAVAVETPRGDSLSVAA